MSEIRKQKQNNLVETNLNGDSVTNSSDKNAVKSDSNDIVSTSSKQNKRVNKKPRKINWLTLVFLYLIEHDLEW